MRESTHPLDLAVELRSNFAEKIGRFYRSSVIGFSYVGLSHSMSSNLSPNERVFGGKATAAAFVGQQLSVLYSCLRLSNLLLSLGMYYR